MTGYVLSILMILSLLSFGACRTPGGKPGGESKSGTAANDPASAGEESEHKLKAKVRRIIAEELGVQKDEVGLDANLADDLQADEFDQVSMIMRLEEEFDLSIPDEDAEKMKTVRDMCSYVKQHRTK